MASVENDNDIVISGIDGRFPKCQNMDELGWNLFNKIDTSTEDDIRWSNTDYPSFPKSKYMIEQLNKFDATLFKIHQKQADAMDPQIRILMELAYSAILDAGVHPASLIGSKTGVFTASSYHESMCSMYNNPNPPPHGHSVLGTCVTFLANRISYALDLKGPSLVIDSACSASITTLSMAVNAMRLNQCDAALVLSTNLQLNANLILHMQTLEIISPDGKCWSFDEKGNGFAKSDAIVAIFLQKRKDAKRIYAEVVHVLCNNDGYKSIGITTPSGVMQSELFSKVYEEANIDPLDVGYVEAHMTGTVQGDFEECFAIDKTFNKNRKGPLLVGAIKPNLGHSEASAGLSSIAKVIHAFETGIIPATIDLKNIRKDIPSLAEGRLKVCTENTELPGPLVGLDSAGFGGSNGHVILRQWHKKKNLHRNDSLPRLVIWSGRTEEAVSTIINKVKSIPLDYEFIGLLHEIQKSQIVENQYRGFGVFTEDNSAGNLPSCLSEKNVRFGETQRQIIWLFTGMGCQWVQMGKSLMQIQSFYESILKCHVVLKEFSMDLISMITTNDSHIFDRILNSLVSITCIQIAMVDMLRLLEIPVDFIIGHSNGELAAAYADGSATLKQTVLLAYYKGKLESDGKTIPGSMAAVGLGYKQIKHRFPPTIFVGCHNSSDSCTISGPKDDVREFVEQLKEEKIFAKVVNNIKIAYHSKYVNDMVPEYERCVRKVVPDRTLRSSKWISSSVPYEQWDTDLGKHFSVEYLANNFKNPVLLEEGFEHLPKNAIIIEIGPHGLLQPIMRRSFPNAVNIPLARRESPNNAAFFMDALGQLFINGINLQVGRLYPQIEFPVSRGTPMISPLIKYEHDNNFSVMDTWSIAKNNSFERKVTIDISQEQYQYLSGHMVDDICLIPATTLCYTVWETLAKFNSMNDVSGFNVEISNIRFHRPITLNPDVPILLIVQIQTNGNFEVTENRKPVVTGTIKHVRSPSIPLNCTKSIVEKTLVLNHDEILKELKLRGYNYRDIFAGLHSYRVDDCSSTIRWQGYWDVFMDSMLQVFLMSKNTRILNFPLSIRKIRINAIEHSKWLENMEDSNLKLCQTTYCKETNSIAGGGVEMCGIEFLSTERRRPLDVEVFEEYQFVPLMDDINTYSITDAVRICTELVIEKLEQNQISVFEVLDDKNEPIIERFRDVISITPLASGHFKLITDRDFHIDSVPTLHPNAMDLSKNTIIIWNSQNSDTSSVIESVSQQGFLIIVRNNEKVMNFEPPTNFTLISTVRCTRFSLLILQRESIHSDVLEAKVIPIFSDDRKFKWLKEIQKVHQEAGKVLLLAERDKLSGLMGFVKTLRVEPGAATYVCVVIDDENAPKFELSHPFYSSQLKLGLPVNVFKHGRWGTYRHLTFKEEIMEEKSYHSLCLQASQSGNLSSIRWVPSLHSASEGTTVRVHYSGLSQRDLLLATRQIPQCTFVDSEVKQLDTYGREFSGVTANGQAVMGMTLQDGTLANEITCSSNDFLFNVPKSMTLQEATSIPVAYLTAYSAFFIGSSINAGQKCLIHNGHHHMGLAAIQIALSYDVDVYTTVSCKDEKDFLLQRFSALKVSLDKLVQNPVNRKRLTELFNNGLSREIIKPLPMKCFTTSQVESIFRTMSTDELTEKVIVKIPTQNELETMKIKPKFVANPKSVYVVTGALGGLGLELTNWLIMRGAKTVVLTSRRGPNDAYQHYKIRFWKSLGCNIIINKSDITTYDGCKALLQESQRFGSVAGIFNLAGIVYDSILMNQTPSSYLKCLGPKAYSTMYLDELSRTICPELEYFVAFSSVVSSRGSAGQTNYAMANSMVDRVIENRVQHNLPGKAIQYGPICDCGMLIPLIKNNNIQHVIGMSLQRPDRCFHNLDDVLHSKSALVSIFQVHQGHQQEETTLFSHILQIFDIKDVTKIRMGSKISDLGGDSLIITEIKQILEQKLNLDLTPNELLALSIEELKKLTDHHHV